VGGAPLVSIAVSSSLEVLRSAIRSVAGFRVGCAAMAEIRAEITANVWQVVVDEGQMVAEGDEICILESMKMEIPVEAPCDGRLAEIRVAEGDAIEEGAVLAVID
jgi:acetyl-CoA carboxylase biotin carboxyl carrier protein